LLTSLFPTVLRATKRQQPVRASSPVRYSFSDLSTMTNVVPVTAAAD